METALTTVRATYYEVLDVDPSASSSDIRKAYLKLAKLHHPDKNKGNKEASSEIFKNVGEAYKILSDSNLRAKYDSKLQRKSTMAMSAPSANQYHPQHQPQPHHHHHRPHPPYARSGQPPYPYYPTNNYNQYYSWSQASYASSNPAPPSHRPSKGPSQSYNQPHSTSYAQNQPYYQQASYDEEFGFSTSRSAPANSWDSWTMHENNQYQRYQPVPGHPPSNHRSGFASSGPGPGPPPPSQQRKRSAPAPSPSSTNPKRFNHDPYADPQHASPQASRAFSQRSGSQPSQSNKQHQLGPGYPPQGWDRQSVRFGNAHDNPIKSNGVPEDELTATGIRKPAGAPDYIALGPPELTRKYQGRNKNQRGNINVQHQSRSIPRKNPYVLKSGRQPRTDIEDGEYVSFVPKDPLKQKLQPQPYVSTSPSKPQLDTLHTTQNMKSHIKPYLNDSEPSKPTQKPYGMKLPPGVTSLPGKPGTSRMKIPPGVNIDLDDDRFQLPSKRNYASTSSQEHDGPSMKSSIKDGMDYVVSDSSDDEIEQIDEEDFKKAAKVREESYEPNDTKVDQEDKTTAFDSMASMFKQTTPMTQTNGNFDLSDFRKSIPKAKANDRFGYDELEESLESVKTSEAAKKRRIGTPGEGERILNGISTGGGLSSFSTNTTYTYASKERSPKYNEPLVVPKQEVLDNSDPYQANSTVDVEPPTDTSCPIGEAPELIDPIQRIRKDLKDIKEALMALSNDMPPAQLKKPDCKQEIWNTYQTNVKDYLDNAMDQFKSMTTYYDKLIRIWDSNGNLLMLHKNQNLRSELFDTLEKSLEWGLEQQTKATETSEKLGHISTLRNNKK